MGRVRPYRPEDRAAVRHICCETGCMGNPVEAVFSDREAFADFFTRYYTDCEPEHAFVAEDQTGTVVGYLLGSLDYRHQPRRNAWLLLRTTIPKVVWRLLSGQYDARNRRFIRWFLFRAAGETPPKVAEAAHFHINLLPAHRDGRLARRLIFGFVDHVKAHGLPRVYGQMQVFEDTRTERAFARYGWQLLARREVTKFREFHDEPVYVATLCKELTD